jgi:hypothetical protein
MTRARKTRDEWRVHGWYSLGWEEVSAAETWSEARDLLRDYRANETSTAFKLTGPHRVPLTGA